MSTRPTRTEAIKKFLTVMGVPMAEYYNHDMECQVNVAQGNGELVEGEWNGVAWRGWTDGVQTWKPFRIPYNAKIDPTYEDKPMTWDIAEHAEAIGMTGWDWKNRVSKWVAFDFDSVANHNNALETDKLEEIKAAAKKLPWVTVRKSTSGQGLHIYVFLNDVPTANHSEHAALARAILGKMSAMTGFDFTAPVDVCGGNMWIWHRKMHKEFGFKLIKQGEKLIDVPENWREHIAVVTGIKRKAHPKGISNVESFEELCSQRIRQARDEEHVAHIRWLDANGYYWEWNTDLHLLVTHTYALKQLHEALQLKGAFDTIATGKDQNDHNCFCFPARNGSWDVRRFTPGCQEHKLWEQDGSGWTRIQFNRLPDLKMAAKVHSGLESPNREEYVFNTGEEAMLAANMLGANIKSIPQWGLTVQAKLRYHKDGRRLIFELKGDKNQHADGWLNSKGWLIKIFNIKSKPIDDPDTRNFDSIVRHIVTEEHADAGWVLKTEGAWTDEPIGNIKMALKAIGEKDIDTIAGNAIWAPWILVSRPFESEYLPNRQWNKNAARFKVPPSQEENLNYPTWKKILTHIGESLNEAVKNHPWCATHGIQTGYDYLKLWTASLIQRPREPLPYLFLYGPQDSGKSILHEALDLIIDRGIVHNAEKVLTNPNQFNGEIANAVLCVLEETDLKGNKTAYNRIKDYVTSKKISIHYKFKTPYEIVNTTHWIHCSNDISAVPIFPGDTRITMIYVPEIEPEDMIPKFKLLATLEKEASDFLGALVNLELPESESRLAIPVIETQDKKETSDANRTLLEEFIDEFCMYAPGYYVPLKDFVVRLKEWIDGDEAYSWSSKRVAKELAGNNKFPKGRVTSENNKVCIGNMVFKDEISVIEERPKFLAKGEKIVQH